MVRSSHILQAVSVNDYTTLRIINVRRFEIDPKQTMHAYGWTADVTKKCSTSTVW